MSRADSQPAASGARVTQATVGATHALHDGFSNGLLLFLPLWQVELGLTLAATGALRAMYSIANSALQFPVSLIAERISERAMLALGTIVLGLGFVGASLSGGYILIAVAIFMTGVGASAQHPLSSSLITRTAHGARLRVALSTYNFLGDVGKVVVPALAAFIVSLSSWRDSMFALGAAGVVLGIAIFLVLPRTSAAPIASESKEAGSAGPTISNWPKFSLLAAISALDSVGRAGALTLLPFVLVGKGAEIATVGFALSLIFAGGACGKFVCGVIATRLGPVATVIATEIVTAVGVMALVLLPISGVLFLLPVLGLALNGTSSVLYGSVPETVARDKIVRSFGLFYTIGSAGSAVAPFVYGALSDLLGLSVALMILAGGVLAIVPMTLALPLIETKRS
ncbi:MAG: MFS transporter [Alphaproteobacteria bacterium]|nr:MFS transporter [Alphaproteobacteria bacterium]